MGRKAFLGAVLVAMLAVACGGGGSKGASGSSSAGKADPNAEVRIGAGEDTWPDQGKADKSTTFAYPLNVGTFDTLVVLGSDYSLQPGLATSWELVPPTTWRFHLRQGVVFSNGKPFTADDVMWTWAEKQKTGKTGDGSNTLGDDSVKKVDDFTVDFTPTSVNNRFPEQVLHPEGAIVPRGNNFDTLPEVGTGPFKVVDYKPKESVTLVRNDLYWGPQKAQVRQLTIRFLPDNQTRLQALKSGQEDMILDLPPDAVSGVKAGPNLRVVSSKPGRNELIYINKSGTPPHDLGADLSIRKAVSLAIDRKAYVNTVFDGNADQGRWMGPESVLGPYANIVTPVPFDPAQAKSVLDADGWKVGSDGIRVKDGRRLSLTYLGTPEIQPAAPQFLQAELKDVGIDMVIKATPDTATRNQLYRAGDYDLDFEPPNQNDGNPAFLPVLRMYSKNPNTAQFAPGGMFDDLAAQSLAAADHAQVQQLSAQMMKILVDDQYIVVPVAGLYRIYGMTKAVNLGDPHPSQTNQSWVSLTKSTS
ncbi:MAG: ABC transporter substrate-binding protein [Acidimicrobiales bacterium]